MKITEIGKNAGIVWRALDCSKREMGLEELARITSLDKTEVAAAIGWLARENKITINESQGDYLVYVFKESYF